MPRYAWFALAVAAQVLILAVKPTEKLIIRHVTGRIITIRTAPVDPYDVMRGYYMTLNYEASSPPGFSFSEEDAGQTVYTLLRKGSDNVWAPVLASFGPPRTLGPDDVLLRGRVGKAGWRRSVTYGLEEYYVPEEVRHEIDREVQKQGRGRILVDIAVDPAGRSSILRLHVGEKTYEY